MRGRPAAGRGHREMVNPEIVLKMSADPGGSVKRGPGDPLTLATTTSVRDSGLLDGLVPACEAETGIHVEAVAVGSGEALALGRRGAADALLVHSPAAEEAFVREGHAALRLAVMHNDFVLAGPAADPARIRGLSAAGAMARIAAARATFVSRGDQSGTGTREMELWRKSGVVAGGDHYVRTGKGMGETVRIAAERRAYVLVDRGTYLALGAPLGLAVLCEDDPDLRNRYHVLVVSPEKHAGVRVGAARRFAEWLVSPGAQRRIADFGRAQHGRPLFVPDALPAGGSAT